MFTDPRNKAIFTNSDYGKTIVRHMIDFTPSEISFYEQDPKTFLVLDKQDPDRKVRNTLLIIYAADRNKAQDIISLSGVIT